MICCRIVADLSELLLNRFQRRNQLRRVIGYHRLKKFDPISQSSRADPCPMTVGETLHGYWRGFAEFIDQLCESLR